MLIVLHFSDDNSEEEKRLELRRVVEEPGRPRLGGEKQRRGRLSLKKGKGGQRKLFFH